MVTIGYSMPYVARYNGTGGKDTYTDGMDLGEGVKYSDSITSADDNNFYANNKVSETDTGNFLSGEATITIDGLSPKAAELVLGIKNKTSVGSTQWDNWDDDVAPPEIGYGHVKMTRENNVDQYWGVVLPRIKCALPGESLETKGENINWQTQDITATIMRSLNGKHTWRSITSTPFASEAEAYEAVKAYLGQTGVGG